MKLAQDLAWGGFTRHEKDYQYSHNITQAGGTADQDKDFLRTVNGDPNSYKPRREVIPLPL